MPAAKTTDHTKKTETFFGESLTLSVYAAIADIDAKAASSLSCTIRYPTDKYQSLENLGIEKELRDQDVGNVFTVSTETKQIFRQLYEKFIDEIKDSNLTVKDTIDGLLAETTGPILTVLRNWRDFVLPETITKLNADKKLYLAGLAMQILGSDFNNVNSLVSQFVDTFNKFVKVFAYKFALMNWHTTKRDTSSTDGSTSYNQGISMTVHYTQAILGAIFEFELDMLEEVASDLREKAERPKRAPKKTAATDTKTETETVVDPPSNEKKEELEEALE